MDMEERKIKSRIFGAKIRDARKRSGLTQEEAAKRLGISQSNLSMLEGGKRRLSAETAEELARLYGENGMPLSDDGNGRESDAVRVVRMLEELAEKSGSKKLVDSADDFICLCGYVMLRKLYMTNRHNKGRFFSVDESDLERICGLIAEEPEKIASFAAQSKEVSSSKIEPDDTDTARFLEIIELCEGKIRN